jgi:hypothetical protein
MATAPRHPLIERDKSYAKAYDHHEHAIDPHHEPA